MSREAWVIIDLGFGDAGKGSIIDFLARDRQASLVVRFNGGAQAGHNVVTDDGRHHTFSQFGAGLFAGASTLLGPDFLLHPLAMVIEAEHLERAGVADPFASVAVDRRARVITPYQQAAVRIREQMRGADAHGTTGVGVGECVLDALTHSDETIYARDLGDAETLRRKLSRQRDRKRSELRALGATDLFLFDDTDLISRVISAWSVLARRLTQLSPEQTERRIADTERLLFEGAQGVLLDEHFGFHPHTTWSDCTPNGARALARDRELRVLGVTRAYTVRHGPGPFPTDGTQDVIEPHNRDDVWQGRFRTGALDCVLLRYAIEVCGWIDGLAVTCLDRVREPKICDSYRSDTPPVPVEMRDGRVWRIIPGRSGDLDHNERLGRWLQTVTPEIEPGDPCFVAQSATNLPVWIESHGPTASGKRWRRHRDQPL